MYLTSEVYSRLNQAFFESGLSISVKSDYVIVENSEDQIEERISKIIESIGFCPLISKDKIENKIAFTISPYRIPDFFHKNKNTSIVLSEKPFIEKANRIDYISFEEASDLLKISKFINKEEVKGIIKDQWSQVNSFRSFVSPALNLGLLDVLSPYIKEESPAVEIGSGIGYTLPESVSRKIIRIQPAIAECQLLNKITIDPIYQLDIDGLYNSLVGSGKKIPLFFALDVFDVIPSDKRKTSLSQLSQLQNPGDCILMMLDTNPCLDVTIEQLELLHPALLRNPYLNAAPI